MMLPEDQTTADQLSSRRRLLRGAGVLAGGAVATAAGVAAASSAQAAPGDPVRLGRVNTSGRASTVITSIGPATLDLRNQLGEAVVASTDNVSRAAIRATNYNSENVMGIGGAVDATGHECAAVIATAYAGHDYAIYAYGFTDETRSERSNAIHAIGNVVVGGAMYIDGDLRVTGTIYCDDIQPLTRVDRADVEAKAQPRPSAD